MENDIQNPGLLEYLRDKDLYELERLCHSGGQGDEPEAKKDTDSTCLFCKVNEKK